MLRMLLRFPKGIFDGAHHEELRRQSGEVVDGARQKAGELLDEARGKAGELGQQAGELLDKARGKSDDEKK